MPNFKFVIREEAGSLRKGNIHANSKDDALSLLKKEGLYILSLEEIKEGGLGDIEIFPKRVSQRDILIFSKQLSIMLQSKITLIESLKMMILEMKNKKLKDVIVKVIDEIKAGETLSSALSKHPQTFSHFYISVVKVGETSGTLSESLLYLMRHIEEQEQIKSKIKTAMIYPIVVTTVMISIVAVIFLWIFPVHLRPVLEGFGVELPLPTRIVIAITDFITGNIIAIISTIILLVVGFFVINKTKNGKYFFHEIYLKIPILGDFLKKVYMTQFTTIFCTSMASGLSLIESLKATEGVIGNMVYKKAITDSVEKTKEGELLSTIVKRHPSLFSSLFVQMLMVGEKTGLVEKALYNVRDIYSEEIDRKIKTGISLMEPMLIIVLAVVVLVIVLAVFLPIMEMTAVKK